MTINKDLLVQTMQYIEDHPEEWVQIAFARRTACGTAFCFAGHALRLVCPEVEFHWQRPSWDKEIQMAWFVRDPDPSDDMGDIGDTAQELLGLTTAQADVLFDCENTMDDLKRHVKTLCDEGVVVSRMGVIHWELPLPGWEFDLL